MSKRCYVLVVAVSVITSASPGFAQLLGDDVEAKTGGVAIDGNNSGDIITGWSAKQVFDLMAKMKKTNRIEDEKLAELSNDLGVTRNAVRTFFSILGEEQVEQSELTKKLVEIAENYKELQQHLEMRSHLDRLKADNPIISSLLDQALEAIRAGNYEEAAELLKRAESNNRADKRFLDAAATRALQGETSLAFLRYSEAAGHFEEAAELVPDSEPSLRARYLAQRGDALVLASQSLDAIKAYQHADAFAEKALDQHSLSVSLTELGDELRDQGDLAGALGAFEVSLSILEGLAADDPNNTRWQDDLSFTYDRIGIVRGNRGDLAGALEAFEANLSILKGLATNDPGSAVRQGNLSIGYQRIGNVHRSQGNLEEAQKAFEASLAISFGSKPSTS